VTDDAPRLPPPADAPPSASGARGRVARGILARSLALVVIFAQQVLLVPLFLHAWGPKLYGDWLTLMAASAVLGLIDGGLNAYFSNRLLVAWSRGEREDFFRALRVGMAHYAIILAAIVPLAAAVLFVVPWAGLLKLGAMEQPTAIATLGLLAAFILSAMPTGMVISVYRARGWLAADGLVATGYVAGPIVAGAVALVLGAGPVTIAALHLCSSLVFWIAVPRDQRRRFAGLAFTPVWPTRAEIRDTVRTAPYYAVGSISMMVTVHATILMVAGFGGAVVVFATMRTLVGFARTIADQVGYVIGPELARRYAQSDAPSLGRLYRFLGRLQGSIDGGISGLVFVLAPPFVSIWTLGKVPMDTPVFVALLATVALAGPAQAAERLLGNINRPRGLAAAFLARAAATVILGALLIPWLGALGAAIAIFVADIIVLGTLLPYAAAAASGLGTIQQLVQSQIAAALAFAGSAAVAYAATWFIGTNGLASILAVAALWIMFTAVPAWFLVLDADMRRWLVEALRRRRDQYRA